MALSVRELQIDDWVLIFDPDYKEDASPYKVSEIREDGIRTHMFTDTYEEGWFEPIPLTGDLLEMNGWKGSALYWECKKCPFELFINMGDGKPFINGHGSVCYDFRYVHQLQHALRLCGLNDLADNFKVN